MIYPCEEHPDRPSVEVIAAGGMFMDCCQECADGWNRRREVADREQRAKSSRAAARGIRAQTFRR